MSLRRLSLGIGSGFLDKAVITIFQLVMVPVLVNSWGLTLFGIWAMLSTVPTMLALSDFGIINSAWARMTMFISRGQIDRGRIVLHTAWLSAGLLGLALILAAAATLYLLPAGIMPSAERLTDGQARLALFLLIVYGVGTIVFRLNTVIFRSAGNVPLTLWCNTASYAFENLVLLGAVLLGADLLTAAICLLVARCFSLGSVFIVGGIKFPYLRPGIAQGQWSEWLEMWRPALSAAVLGLGTLAFLQLSVLALGAAAGAAAVPAFVAVRTLSRVGLQMAQLVAGPVAQEFSQEMGAGRQERAGRYFGLVLATSALMSVCIAVGLVLFGTTFVRIWTAGAIETSFTLMLLMAISSAAAVLWNTLANLVSAVNRQGAFSNTNLAISVAGLALIGLTGDRLGTVSAGLAFAVVDVVTVMAVGAFLWREWWPDAAFRTGCIMTIRQLRSPLATIKAIRQQRS